MFQRWFTTACSLLILVFPTFALSQTGKIAGYVRDHYSGEPLPNTNVLIKGKNIGVAANHRGYFVLKQVPAGTHVVEVSRIGYAKYSEEVEIESAQTITLNLFLKAEVVKFSEVLVTATRENALQNEVAVATEVITRSEIERTGSQNVGEVLEFASGIFVKNYGHIGGLKTASIRGANSNQVLILVDGQRLNLAQGIALDLSDIPLHAIERIEIIRGGNSALYGTDAVGGVINLITRSASENKPLSGQLTSTFGSFGTHIIAADFGQRLGTMDYFIAHNYTESDGDFRFENTERQTVKRTNNSLKWNDTFVKLRYVPNPATVVSGSVQIHDADRQAPGPLSFPSESATQKDNSWKYNIYFQHEFSRNIRLQAQTYFFKFDLNFDDPEAFFPIQSEHKNEVYGFNLQSNWQLSNFSHITGGYEFHRDITNSTDIASQSRDNHSVFLQNQIKLPTTRVHGNSSLTFIPAVRLDKYSDLDVQVSPKMGILFGYMGGFQMNLRGNWGRSFRAASFSDLYWPAGPFTAGNPHLNSEKGSSFDLGVLFHFKKSGFWGLEANYFNTDMEGLIVWGPGADGVWRPQNVQEANIKGIETNVTFSDPGNIIGLKVDYTYLVAVDAGSNGIGRNRQLIYRPKHKMDAKLNVNVEQFAINGGFRFVDKRFTTADNSGALDAYRLADVGTSWKQPLKGGRLKIQIELRNVFDKKIQIIEGFPAPGREFRSSLGFEF